MVVCMIAIQSIKTPLTFDLIRTFQRVALMARPGGFRKAAPRLKLSQPAVNNCIQDEAQASRAGFLKACSEQYSRVNVDISINLRADLLDHNLGLALPMGPISEFTVQNVALPAFGLHWYLARANPQIDPHALPVISYSSETRPLPQADVGAQPQDRPWLRAEAAGLNRVPTVRAAQLSSQNLGANGACSGHALGRGSVREVQNNLWPLI